MADGLLHDRRELEELFAEVGAELATLAFHAEVIMVGGAWMLWHAQRAATRDVDSARRLPGEIAAAVARVGARHDLPAGWLNDHAAAFWPAGASFDDCTTVFEHPSLTVRAPLPETVFVMKLYRADPQDREDMITLWPMCRFRDAREAAAAFERAYPHAPDDPYLVDYIDQIAEDAATS